MLDGCFPLGRRVKRWRSCYDCQVLLLLMEDGRRSICLGDIKMLIAAALNGRWKEKHLSDCDAEWGKNIGIHFVSDSTSVFFCKCFFFVAEFQTILPNDNDRYHQLIGALAFTGNPLSRFLCGGYIILCQRGYIY